MKSLFLFFGTLLASLFVYSQEPCCSVIGISPSTSSVTVRNNTTGRLFMFRASQKDIQPLKMGDAVSTNASYTYVVEINNNNVQFFVAPVNLTQNIITETTGLVKLDYGNPIGMVIYINNDEVIGFQNQVSGQTFHFKVPSGLGTTIKPGTMIYTQQIDNKTYAILNSRYLSTGSGVNVFTFPVDEANGTETISTSSWTLKPSTETPDESGRLNTDFPDGVEWGIDIYTGPGVKLMRNRLTRDKQLFYPMKPGNYGFKLNNVLVDRVPIEVGKETRLRTGYLNIKTMGAWSLYYASKVKVLLTNFDPKKIALPVGNYQLKIYGEFIPILIKDGETIDH